jgi:hypothetical protein
MKFYIRYIKGLGDTGIYTRLRDASGNFWDFVALEWTDTLDADCKVYLIEYPDDDPIESLYASTESTAPGGPWIEEAVRESDDRVIGYGDSETIDQNVEMTLKQLLFGYIGDADNVFSKLCGSITAGSISFYVCSYEDLIANAADPANATLLVTLSSAGVASDYDDIDTNGDVLFFKLSSDFATGTTYNIVFNIYNATTTANTRVYIPAGLAYSSAIDAYYPTINSGLMIANNNSLIYLGETVYGKNLSMISNVDWTRISQPVQLTTTTTIV